MVVIRVKSLDDSFGGGDVVVSNGHRRTVNKKTPSMDGCMSVDGDC